MSITNKNPKEKIMEATQETEEQQAAAEKESAETKAAEEKAAAEKTATEEKAAAEQDAAAEKIGVDFDKKVDEEGDAHSAYTEKTEDEKKAEAEAEAKAKADEESSKKASDEEVDESLLERAEQAGMSREKAGEFGSKEDLERAVELLENVKSEKEKSPDELEAEKKAKEEAEAKAKDDEAPYECKLDPDEYDEGLIKAVNELGTEFKKRIVALEAGQSKHAKAVDSDRVTRHTDWLDSQINRLKDDDLKKVYGEGDIDDLEEGSEQFKARAALDTKITKIAAGLRKANKTVPSRNKLFGMAIEALHKGKTKKADAKTKAAAEERKKQSLGGGSSRVSAESAEAEALQTNKDFDHKLDEEEA
jgi:hypothetical protein